MAWRLITGRASTPLCELGWKSLGVLELTALPSINEEHWLPMVRETDAQLVGGGDPLYLSYWIHQSGLADVLSSLRKTVYVGVSAGSMVMAPAIGEDFARWRPPSGGDRNIQYSYTSRSFPTWTTRTCLEQAPWSTLNSRAASVPGAEFDAIDDQTAIKVLDGAVEVVTRGALEVVHPLVLTPLK